MMDMKKSLAGLALVALLAGSALAARSDDMSRSGSGASAGQTQGQSQSMKDQKSMTMPKTSDLIGKDIVGANNETLGTLDDIAVNRNDGRIAYGVLAYGGFLGIGEKYHAVPWDAFQLRSKDDDQVLALNITQDQLEQSQGFERNNWPMSPTLQVGRGTTAMGSETHSDISDDVAMRQSASPDISSPSVSDQDLESRDLTFEDDTSSYGYMGDESLDADRTRDQSISRDQAVDDDASSYGYMGDQSTKAPADQKSSSSATGAQSDVFAANGQLLKLSQISGWSIRHGQHGDIGEIKDLVVDMKHGHLVYAIVDFNNTVTQLNDRVAVVPWSALSLDAANNAVAFRSDIDVNTLTSVSYAEDQLPDLSDRSFAQRLHSQFNVEPYWQVFGYVGDEASSTGQQMKSDVQKGAKEMKKEAHEMKDKAKDVQRDIDRNY